MSDIYNQAYLPAPKRNKFTLGEKHDTTLDAGWIVPVCIKRLVPGDTFKGSLSHKIRTFALKSPAFQSFDVSWFVFQVPCRILQQYENWQKFIAEDDNASIPYCRFDMFSKLSYHFNSLIQGVEPQSLANYLGMPVWMAESSETLEDDTPINLMPFLAYQKIYDEWFRDENVIGSDWDELMDIFGRGGYFEDLPMELVPAFKHLTQLRHRAFRKDRFTSALPQTQKGAEVIVPLGTGEPTKIPVQNIDTKFRFGGYVPSISDDINLLFGIQVAGATDLNGTTQAALGSAYRIENSPNTPYGDVNPVTTAQGAPFVQVQLGDGTGVYVNLETIPGVSVSALRSHLAIQRFLERLEICGSRYTEVIRGMFGVFTPDARLQRPELVAAYRSSVLIGDVLQTEQSAQESEPAGTLRGMGISIGKGANFRIQAYEYGYMIVLCSILPRQSYAQGLPKLFTDVDRYDNFWPLLAHQGEEPVLNRELYFQPGNKDDNEGVFGYQSRYYDYRSSYDRISGYLSPGENLDYWQGSRGFDNLPTLSAQFIECRFEDSDLDRIFPMEYYPGKTEGFFIASCYVDINAYRPMPKFALPSIV